MSISVTREIEFENPFVAASRQSAGSEPSHPRSGELRLHRKILL
jgi:hypothetical protein